MEKPNNKKSIVISILFSLLLIFGVVNFVNSNKSKNNEKQENEISSNVEIIGEEQLIYVTSRMGGYSPRMIYAKADIPTKLVIDSLNSYGCERAFQIPSLDISETLPNNGETTFDLGIPKEDILGTCSMGMYTFLIKFI